MITSILLLLSSAIFYCLPAAESATDNRILVNEVEVNPPGNDSGGEEKVELYNPSNNTTTTDISGWTLSSTPGTATATIVIREGTTIPPKGYLVIQGDSQQQWLDNDGEVVKLMDDSGMLIDSAGPFSDAANDDKTWQRSPDGNKITGSFQGLH
ncbi:MAG: lamin tail domain-containing protein [Thermoproteota archaeon]|nr:lamin tail domain-containing protein [Thermoproteota archaeon]